MNKDKPNDISISELIYGGLTDEEKDDIMEIEGDEYQLWRLTTKKAQLARMRELKGERRSAKKRKK